MYARKVRRKCSIRGCKCTESFAISKTREIGNSVIICKNCLKAGLIAIDEIKPKAKTNIPKSNPANIPSLFFNAQIKPQEAISDEAVKESETVEDETEEQNAEEESEETVQKDSDTEDAEDETEFRCSDCGKVFDSERGLKSHARYCEGQKK